MDCSSLSGFPMMALFRQNLISRPIRDIRPEVISVLEPTIKQCAARPGESVAIAVGSRRIDQIDQVVFSCIDFLKAAGLRPFIVPAMGSHGGATPEGQEAVLAGYNIDETTTGAPIRFDMETVELGEFSPGLVIRFSKAALAADHILVINRIKPHTKFHADIESGLCKMLTVGLGKAEGAAAYHRFAVKNSFAVIEEAAKWLLGRVPIVAGLGLVEDGYGRLSIIRAFSPETMISGEKALLREARAMMGRIPFSPVDVLVVDEIGKDISGVGMDPNITGRHRDIIGDYAGPPMPSRIFVRDLSPGSDGNACGIGLADFTTCRLLERLDREKTMVNALAAISPEKAAVPIWFDSDRESLAACILTCGLVSGDKARIVRIKNTSSLEYFEISKPLETDIRRGFHMERISSWRPVGFDENGNLLALDVHV